MTFNLSHALFSSYDIDQGSKLLLKAISDICDSAEIRSILDIGCGVGVLGIAAAKACPGASLLMRDRDALACEFSYRNAVLNKLPAPLTERALFIEGLEGKSFDLALCNVPAKAGPGVLDSFLRDMPRLLSDSGYGAIVLVKNIAGSARASILNSGAKLLKTEEGSGHSVFVFKRGVASGSGAYGDTFWAASKRSSEECIGRAGRYNIDGYWGLSEFDSPSFDTKLLMEMADKASSGLLLRKIAVINPGVGRFAAFLKNREPMAAIDLAGRDFLALRASARNLSKMPAPQEEPQLFSFSSELPDSSYDMMAERPDIVPLSDFAGPAWENAMRCLKLGASYMAAMPSAYMDRLMKQKPRAFIKLQEKKKKGYSCAVFRLETK
ncbi:hypothetical protein MASR2M29_14970 [Spirochaetota bacterium]